MGSGAGHAQGFVEGDCGPTGASLGEAGRWPARSAFAIPPGMNGDLEDLFQQQLGALTPGRRMIAGVVAIVFGTVLLFAWPGAITVSGLSVLGILGGLALALTGRAELVRQRRFDAEVRRAQAEWGDLQRELGNAERTGRNKVRLLQDRGYREFAVRRWILKELG